MNKKLRLLVTTKCPNNCTMCCNKQFDFSTLPIVDRWDYDEIMITGGEPGLFPDKVFTLIEGIRGIAGGLHDKLVSVYVYTSSCSHRILSSFLYRANGIVVTPHTKKDIEELIETISIIDTLKNKNSIGYNIFNKSSLILKLDKEMKSLIPEDLDLSMWQVKEFEWENCPLPEGVEDFRRINKLWR